MCNVVISLPIVIPYYSKLPVFILKPVHSLLDRIKID